MTGSTSRGPLLQVEGLVAGYGSGAVLHGIDLEVGHGEILALLGRNGVGKTTFIHCVMGMVRPRGGSVRVLGHDVTGLSPHLVARKGVALVPQGRRVFPPLTVDENLRIAQRGNGPWTLKKVYDLLPRLTERIHNKGDQLSGGEQQMLAIGRALLSNPEFILLDEPSDGLAPLVVQNIGNVLKALRDEGMAGVIVEQDLHLALGLSDKVAIMQKGEIVHRAATSAFRHDHATARRLLGVA